ncbi:hypothetical protein H1R20_g2116, partial [Candolleomyces eurysporus]
MFVIALSLLSCCHFGFGAPFTASSDTSVDLLDPNVNVLFITNYRSTPEIVWTCLITTFLCTWVSMHPDIAGYNSTRWQRLRQRITMFVLAFVVPEVALLGALRQWVLANDLVCKIGKREGIGRRMKAKFGSFTAGLGNLVVKIFGERIASKLGIQQKDGLKDGLKDGSLWKMLHGHLLLMGGVIFSVDGRLEYLELRKLLKDGNDNEPDANDNELFVSARVALENLPSRNMEILDRCKGDAISKGLTFLQTSWFIVQLAARRVQNLNVTALEIVTLAYAVTTLFVYIFCNP